MATHRPRYEKVRKNPVTISYAIDGIYQIDSRIMEENSAEYETLQRHVSDGCIQSVDWNGGLD